MFQPTTTEEMLSRYDSKGNFTDDIDYALSEAGPHISQPELDHNERLDLLSKTRAIQSINSFTATGAFETINNLRTGDPDFCSWHGRFKVPNVEPIMRDQKFHRFDVQCFSAVLHNFARDAYNRGRSCIIQGYFGACPIITKIIPIITPSRNVHISLDELRGMPS